MTHASSPFILIDQQQDLDLFASANKDVTWLALDTEFVGEKRYTTRLCLIQIASAHGNYIIDPFNLDNLNGLLDLIVNPDIRIITHAGENEYRILYQQYGIVPSNVFDTQLAAAFLGYKHPVSFRRIAENELGLRLDKTLTTANWESRPLNPSYLQYAMDDVIPLYPLMQQLEQKLIKHGRLDWAKEEFAQLESTDYYEKDPHAEALGSSMIKSLKPKEQICLIRLFQWRKDQAEAKNYSKEMILPAKQMGAIVRGAASGLDALLHNRRLPERTIKKYGALFVDMYRKPASEEEKSLIKKIEREESDDPMDEILQEIIYLLIRYRCLELGITPAFVMTKGTLRKLKMGLDDTVDNLGSGWRRSLLGDDIYHWLANYDKLELSIASGKIELVVR
jgi:ribonuclease D